MNPKGRILTTPLYARCWETKSVERSLFVRYVVLLWVSLNSTNNYSGWLQGGSGHCLMQFIIVNHKNLSSQFRISVGICKLCQVELKTLRKTIKK